MIQLGELRNQFSRDLGDRLEKVINDHQHKDNFFILITSKENVVMSAQTGKTVIETKFILLDQIPGKMLASICLYVNNRQGRLEVLWALPLDMTRPPEVMTDEIVPRVAESATGMPIIH